MSVRRFSAQVWQQIIGEPQTQRLVPIAVVRQAEIVEDGLQEGGTIGEMAIGEECADECFRRGVPGGYSRAAFCRCRLRRSTARNLHRRQWRPQPGQGGLVKRGRIVKRGIRRRRERPTLQPEAIFIHLSDSPKAALRMMALSMHRMNKATKFNILSISSVGGATVSPGYRFGNMRRTDAFRSTIPNLCGSIPFHGGTTGDDHLANRIVR